MFPSLGAAPRAAPSLEPAPPRLPSTPQTSAGGRHGQAARPLASPQTQTAPPGGSGRRERCPRPPAPTSNTQKLTHTPPKPAALLPAASSSSSSAPGHPAATSEQGMVLGGGQGWSLVAAGSPLSLVAGGRRRTLVPTVSPTSSCCRFGAGTGTLGSGEPRSSTALLGVQSMAEALASPTATPGETEARSTAPEEPGLGHQPRV